MSAYHRLMASPGLTDPFDRHVFACILAKGLSEVTVPLGAALGLGRAALEALLARHFPGCAWLFDGQPEGFGGGEEAIEEEDFRRLLLDGADGPSAEDAAWLAALVARRSLAPGHLWQDLGLASRADLSGLLLRHFGRLARRNDRDMKWKKFFYRQMCEAEGMTICKSPICDECSDFDQCFGGED
jgi:nitrogen fixation protein NifQ